MSPSVWPETPPTPAQRASYAGALPQPYWLDALPERGPEPSLRGAADADLCIVGGGFTGLWAALAAKTDDPSRDVVLLEADTVAFGASGRNGGFVVSSLTHGLHNGEARFADEMQQLERLGLENFEGLADDLQRHSIACDFERTGELVTALEPHEQAEFAGYAELLRRYGHEVEIFGAEALRAEVASPLFRGGLWDKTGAGLLDPGKLAHGLLGAVLGLGVRVHEHSPAVGLRSGAAGVEVTTPGGTIHAKGVLLGTSAYPPLLRSIRRYVAPIYDYVLVSEPLSPQQRAAIGWERRQGLTEGANQFHYYRQTADHRILFGGYDAIYRFRGPVGPHLDQHDASFAKLAQHFFTIFPQLEGLRFTHRWGGAIDTCSRFSAFFGTAHKRRVSYVTGYTGLGVGATRFGARVALDLLDGRETEATRTRYVRRKPLPFPPEPLRWAGVQVTRNRLAAADRNQGRRGLWLRTLDRLGLGFDS